MKSNVTLRIDDELVREAKILAARRGTSLSRLMAEELKQLVHRDQSYDKAMKLALKDMEKAPPLGFQGAVARDELHER
jgi:predicted transcriptional regulator